MSRRTATPPGDWLAATAAVVLTLLVMAGLLVATTDDTGGAVKGLLTGAISNEGRVDQWLAYSSYLMLTGAAVCLVFRVGQFSIGAEGQLVVGALAAGVTVLHVADGRTAMLAAVGAALVGGFVWGLLPGLMKAYMRTDEIISTLMLNYVALFGFAYVVKRFLAPPDAGFPVSEFFLPDTWLPSIGGPQGVPGSFLAALVACVLTAVLLTRSRLGLKLRLVGDSESFARAVGLPVPRLIWLSMALSGALAGLAGGVIALGDTHRLILGISAGLGYDGILVALLALNRPLLVPITGLAYGYLRTGGDVIQITDGIPRDVVTVLQGVLVLVMAVALQRRSGRRRTVDVRVHDNDPAPIRGGAERSSSAQAEDRRRAAIGQRVRPEQGREDVH